MPAAFRPSSRLMDTTALPLRTPSLSTASVYITSSVRTLCASLAFPSLAYLSTVSIADGLLYVAETFGPLHCLDAETGQCYWVHETNSEIWGSTLVADGRVYMPTTKGLQVLAADKKKRVLSQVSVGTALYASPVAAKTTGCPAATNP